MADAYYLTQQDVLILKDMIARVKGRPVNEGGRQPPPGPLQQPPEVHIALTPAGGIPALNAAGTGTGTGTGTDIGGGDIPGSAECTIYRVIDGRMELAHGVTRTVYNLGAAIAGNTWVEAKREKWGTWLAQPTAVTSGGVTVEEADGSPSYAGVTTLRFDQADGFTVSQPSAGVARVDFSGGGGSGITVKEQDGTPSYSSVTTLQVNQADGMVLTQPSANNALLSINDASVSGPGIVSTGAQEFDGQKTFDDIATFEGGLWVGNPKRGAFNLTGTLLFYDSSFVNIASITPGVNSGNGSLTFLTTASGVSATTLVLDCASDHLNLIGGAAAKYSINQNFVQYNGVTGSVTLAPVTGGGTSGALIFRGGIITSFTAPT